MSTVLKMEHIEKVYGNQVRALHDISLEVRAGEFVAVIGPSGSGKSTLLRTVNQLVVPSGGHVYIDGEEVTGASGKKLRLLRRKVGMIFQHYNLVQRLSVMQNVLHGRLGYMSALDGMLGNYTEEDKRKAIDLLQEIEMGDRLYNRASDLSGGQKQRVGIARAIMQVFRRGGTVDTTRQLYALIEGALSFLPAGERKEAVKKSCQRTFQALRIDVNSEFEVLYAFLEKLPHVLKPGGRAAILTFHSGEDRLVKQAFRQQYRDGLYSDIAQEVTRPSPQECRRNPRAHSTKLRWAVRAE